jgi:peptidoglycan-associated lipoprotein
MKWIMVVFALSAIMTLGACKKKVAPPPPPPPPPPAAPTASLTANPNTVEKGQPTTLTWETTNATDINIDGSTTGSERYGRRAVLANCKGCLLRLRQVRCSR